MKQVSLLLAIILAGCQSNKSEEVSTDADSLAYRYAALEDSVHQSWQTLIRMDSAKTELMKELARQLSNSGATDQDALASINTRIQNLGSLRFTQQNLNDANLVEEYDFASSSLINELASQADAQNSYPQDTLAQRLVDDLRDADDRTDSTRDLYDRVVTRFNDFVKLNGNLLPAPHPSYPQFDTLTQSSEQ